MSATRDWMWRTNSRSTASRSSRIGSKICARSAESGEFCIMSANNELPGKDRFTILELLAGCQRAKPLLLSSFRQRAKEHCEIARHLGRKIAGRNAADLRKLRDDVRDIGRFVPLAAVRYRRQIRRVRLSQNSISRRHSRCRTDRVCTRKRQDPCKREIEIDVERRT